MSTTRLIPNRKPGCRPSLMIASSTLVGAFAPPVGLGLPYGPFSSQAPDIIEHMFETTTSTIDDLETALIAREAEIARCRAEQLALLRALDAAQVAPMDGCRSFQEWTASRLDVAPERARDLVDAARVLDDHPDLEERLHDGVVSFDRARETARLAHSGADSLQIEESRGWDIAGIRRMVARRRPVDRAQEQQVFQRRYLAMQPSLDESSWRLWGQLPGLEGAVVDAALRRRADEFPELPSGGRDGLGQRSADALVTIAHDSLDGGIEGGASSVPLVTVFVDAEVAAASAGAAGAAVAGGPWVGASALEQILCECRVEVTTSGGEPLALGRTTRVVSPRLRRFVLHRDGGCAADGCTSRYRLQAHHRVPYSEGGRTDPTNLITLCWYHHHVVIHGSGYRIDPRSSGSRLRFLHPSRGPP